MPQIRKTGMAAAGTATLAAANIFILAPMVMKTELSPGTRQMVSWGIMVATPLLGAWASRRYPNAGPAFAGASLGTLFTALAVMATGDLRMAASSPQMADRLESLMGVNDLEDYPQALGLALTGGA